VKTVSKILALYSGKKLPLLFLFANSLGDPPIIVYFWMHACSLKLKSTLILKVSNSQAVSQRDSVPGREKFSRRKLWLNLDALIYQYLADKSAGSQWKLSIKSVLQVSLHSNPGTLSLGKSADGK